MKIPKYSCSVCKKPSSRKWNLYRHISSCHAGIGNCLSNWDFSNTYIPYWNRLQKAGINQQNFHHIQADMMNDFFANRSYDRNPDYGRVLVEAYLREVAKRAVSLIQPTKSMISSPFPFSPYRTYSMDPEASLQIFGFRGYVCDKCLTAETHYVAFPEAKGQGGLQRAHFCDPANAVAARESAKALHGRIPELMKQKVNSRNGNYNYLFALRLPQSS